MGENTQQLGTRVPETLVDEVDSYQENHSEITSRSAAIRDLIVTGLEAQENDWVQDYLVTSASMLTVMLLLSAGLLWFSSVGISRPFVLVLAIATLLANAGAYRRATS